MTTPEHPRGGVFQQIEDGKWMMTLAGTAGDYPPTDEPSFLEYAHSLPTLELYNAIKDAKALSPILASA